MRGPCAKQVVTATLVTPGGRRYAATNHCETPQAVCPRELAGMKSGEGYELCRDVCAQAGHAEANVLALAGMAAHGATLYVEGHTRVCQPCALAAWHAGVDSVFIGPPPPEIKERPMPMPRPYPIETAPLDGRFILLFGPSGYTTTALRCEVCSWEEDRWRNHGHRMFADGGSEPTGWLPLPGEGS